MSNIASSPAACPSVRGSRARRRPAAVAVHDAGHMVGDPIRIDVRDCHCAEVTPGSPRQPCPGLGWIILEAALRARAGLFESSDLCFHGSDELARSHEGDSGIDVGLERPVGEQARHDLS